MSTLKDLLETIGDSLKNKGENKVIRTIKPSPEFRKTHKQCKDLANESFALLSKAKTLRNKMWAEVEIEHDLYSNNLRFDEEEGVIEVLKGQDDDEE
jgi:hypothetical protein